jgi:chromosomal replication initiation ATPase DnaA
VLLGSGTPGSEYQDDDELKAVLAASRYAVGDERFIKQSEADLKDMKVARYIDRDVIRSKERVKKIGVVEEAVAREFGVDVGDLHFHGRRAGAAKSVAIELSCRLTGKSQRAIGSYYGYRSESSVGKQRKRLASLSAADSSMAKRIEKLSTKVLNGQ